MATSDFGDSENEAGPSRLWEFNEGSEFDVRETSSHGEASETVDLGEGMDPEGFSGPSLKIVEPLTKEALKAFKAEQEKAGVIYISRIPPGMRPAKVRHLMSAYGTIGRVYLQQEGTLLSVMGGFCLDSSSLIHLAPSFLLLQTPNEPTSAANIPRLRKPTSRKAGSSSSTSV